MSKIGLFYGSTTGNTEDAAEIIQQSFNHIEDGLVEIFNVVDDGIDNMPDYKILILGVSTWDIGVLQYDWDDVFDDLDDMDFNGIKVAIFGLGDQVGYPDTFQDAIGILGKKMRERGAQLVGFTSTDGFEFDESAGVESGRFMGLSLDEDNQSNLTEGRIASWVAQLQKDFEL